MQIILKPGAALLLILALGSVCVYFLWFRSGDEDGVRSLFRITDSQAAAATATPAPPVGGFKIPFQTESLGAKLKDDSFESGFGAVQPFTETKTVTGKIASGWYDGSSWAANTVSYASDKTNPHSGDASQRIDATAIAPTSRISIMQPLRLPSGKKYSAGFWLRADHPMTVQVVLREFGPTRTVYGQTDAKIGTTWTHVNASGTIGTNPVTLVALTIPETGKVWVDDASLTQEH